MVNPVRILLHHALLIERLDLVLFEYLIVLLVDLGKFHWDSHLFLFEVIE